MKGRFDAVNFDQQAIEEQNMLRNKYKGFEQALQAGNELELDKLALPTDEYFSISRRVFSLLKEPGINPYHILEILYALDGKRIRRECKERTRQLIDV